MTNLNYYLRFWVVFWLALLISGIVVHNNTDIQGVGFVMLFLIISFIAKSIQIMRTNTIAKEMGHNLSKWYAENYDREKELRIAVIVAFVMIISITLIFTSLSESYGQLILAYLVFATAAFVLIKVNIKSQPIFLFIYSIFGGNYGTVLLFTHQVEEFMAFLILGTFFLMGVLTTYEFYKEFRLIELSPKKLYKNIG